MEIILASASPRRKELLSMLCPNFRVEVSTAEEITDPALSPAYNVSQLSLLKAQNVSSRLLSAGKDAIVIGADTVVCHRGKILGKPKDKDDAFSMLTALADEEHSVITGVTVMHNTRAKSETFFEETKVRFYPLTENEIRVYINGGEPMDKAGAYGIQGQGALFVKGITGDFYNVVGLPVAKLARVLKTEFGITGK